MDLVEELRLNRKTLVVAAEDVAKWMFEPGRGCEIKKAQLNHLIGVCGEAECAEEIENYLRYQASRKNTGWTPVFSDKVIEAVAVTLGKLSGDRGRTEAWRLYAIFLTRAFTYQDATKGQRAAGRPPAPQGQTQPRQRDQRGGQR